MDEYITIKIERYKELLEIEKKYIKIESIVKEENCIPGQIDIFEALKDE